MARIGPIREMRYYGGQWKGYFAQYYDLSSLQSTRNRTRKPTNSCEEPVVRSCRTKKGNDKRWVRWRFSKGVRDQNLVFQHNQEGSENSQSKLERHKAMPACYTELRWHLKPWVLNI